jgi:hypothetical protein
MGTPGMDAEVSFGRHDGVQPRQIGRGDEQVDVAGRVGDAASPRSRHQAIPAASKAADTRVSADDGVDGLLSPHRRPLPDHADARRILERPVWSAPSWGVGFIRLHGQGLPVDLLVGGWSLREIAKGVDGVAVCPPAAAAVGVPAGA